MTLTTGTNRRRPSAVRGAVLSLCAAGALALTGCSGGGSTGGAAADADPSATRTTAPGGRTDDGSGAASAQPASKTSTGTGSGTAGGTKAPGAKTSASTPTASPTTTPAGSGGTGDGCDHKMPISPDEIAVYRYTPEGGSLSLIVKYGNWGCGTGDSDGAPFETVGKETYLPMDQAAYVTATNPVVESSENQRIGVQEFLDWLEAHPDSGLVFKYHLGKDGAIDSLEEVFTP
ncbi:hypothetical protein AB5J56_40620 [Streptomyces sp. R21]|uniref:Lipoprotein n=1 Tax=Streptomyces sp. R21 TaxID=3238627 RepID=A0AB39PHX7_9ACTN